MKKYTRPRTDWRQLTKVPTWKAARLGTVHLRSNKQPREKKVSSAVEAGSAKNEGSIENGAVDAVAAVAPAVVVVVVVVPRQIEA